MADNQVNVDYTIGTAQAHKELERVRISLNKVTGEFLVNVGTIETAIANMTKAMAEKLDEASKISQASFLQARRRQDQIAGSIYSRAGQGGTESGGQKNQARRAAGQAAINDILNTTEQVEARISDTIVKATIQALRKSDEMVKARIKQGAAAAEQILLNSSDRYLSAKTILAEQRRQDQIYSAENGRSALASRNRLEQINYNGGADLMGIQGRVMMNYAAVGTMFNTIKATVAGVIELDKELHQFQAISTATNREMVGFKKNLLEISATVPFTSLEMTKAATMLAQAGLSTTEVVQSLGAVTKFATASGSDLSQAVDVVTSSLTAFNLETTRTEDVANTFTAALNLSKLSVDKMVTALNYIGPTANEVGLTLEETTAVLGALSQSGIRASTMGTGFRALLTDLQSPSKKLVATLSAAGLSVEDINVKTKGFLPVIERLKTAGFGAAEAYESLELRSAAAYVALSNNTQMAYELQRSFILTAAATEANDIQMKSFSNTVKNLGSVLTAAAYTGFEPVLAVMQKVADWTTKAMSGLLEIPGALKIIAVAATTLGTVMATSLGISLLRSLTLMTPVLASIRSGLTLMAAEALAAGGIISGLGAALKTLTLISFGGWLGIAATAAIAATTAFYAWSDSTKTLSEEIDDLRGRTNELQGAADATEKKITSIDQAIQGVIDRKAELETNDLMRGAKIDELRHQFAELGLSIKDDTISVADLIRELHNLKQTSSSIRAAELAEVNANRALEIQKLELEQKALLKDASPKFDDALTTLEYGKRRAVNDQKERDHWVREAAKKFSPSITGAIQFANRDLSVVGDDPLTAKALINHVNTEMGRLTLNPSPTHDRDMMFLQVLKETLEPLVQNITQLAVARHEVQRGIKEEEQENIRASNAYKVLDTRTGTIQTNYTEQLSELQKSPLTSDKKLEALEALDAWLEQVTEDALETFRRNVELDQGIKDLNSEQVARTFGDRLRALGLSANGEQNAAQTQQRKIMEKDAKRLSKLQTENLSRLRRNIAGASDQYDLKAAKEAYDTFLKVSTGELKKHYEELIKITADPDALEMRRDELADTLERLQKDGDLVNDEAVKKEQDLVKESLQRQKEAIADTAKGLRTEIEQAQKELDRTPPSAAFEALVTKIRELTRNLGNELDKISNIDTRIEGIDLSQPISEAVVGSAHSVMQHYISRGFSKAGAAAIAANLSAESNFNPRAKGDVNEKTGQYTAFGLAQWRFDRWEALQKTGKPWDMNTQLDYVITELSQKFPKLLARLMAGTEDVQVLAESFMWEYERPNRDPNKNHLARRKKEAQAFNTGFSSSNQAEIKRTTEKTDLSIEKSTLDQLKSVQDATIKNLNSRLSTLRTQARINEHSTSLEEVQKKVKEAHAKIEEAELAKFDAENKEYLKLPDVQSKRDDLREKLGNNLNNDILKVMEAYYKAAEEELNQPVGAAKAKLDAARQPDLAHKFTSMDINKMEQEVRDREREAAVNRVLLIEKQIAEVRQYAAEADKKGATMEADMWRLQENELIARNNELKATNNALDAAKAAQGPSTVSAIQAATKAWGQSNGVLNAAGEMIPLAVQVGNTWGQVLDGLSNGFSQFFMNITSGTMTAGEAFKQLGQSILQMFMQIISKALANQIIMALFGEGKTGSGKSSGGSFLSLLGEALFGVVGGAANGGAVRAANGRVVRNMASGGSPFRDSGNYALMDGEYVLRQSAVQAIGVDKLDALNNLGNRQISEGSLKGKALNDNQKQGTGSVNVWVVSQDQVPPPGPNDIVAAVAQNIQNRGSIKQLIQQVQMGAI